MGPRRIIVLLIAVVAAGGTAMYARSWVAGQQVTVVAAPAPTEEIHEVLIATQDLPAGTFVKAPHLRWQRWPTDDVPESYVLKGKRSDGDMVGAVVRRRIAAGEPMTDGLVVKPGDRGFLAAVLEPGMRAVSVPVSPISTHSGLVFPGDRVDMILTQSLAANDGESSVRRVSETVLSNIRIIAVGGDTSDDPEEGKANNKAKTATFEVTPQQAEQITLLTELGKLSLSLRSLAVPSSEQTATVADAQTLTWDRDVSRVLRSGRISTRLLVLRGSNAEDVQVQEGRN